MAAYVVRWTHPDGEWAWLLRDEVAGRHRFRPWNWAYRVEVAP